MDTASILTDEDKRLDIWRVGVSLVNPCVIVTVYQPAPDYISPIKIINGTEVLAVTEIDNPEEILKHKIFNVIFPPKWRNTDIMPPTVKCKEQTLDLVISLYRYYRLFPDRVSATIEGGMFINYRNSRSGKELSIEIYNDLDVAAIITKQNEIIRSYDLDDENFAEVIANFES